MTSMSRCRLLAGLAVSSAASFVTAVGEQPQSSAANKELLFSGDERSRCADPLLGSFAANAVQLLRAPDGILKHPSVSPSLPGKQYSTQLWDWDTLWIRDWNWLVLEMI